MYSGLKNSFTEALNLYSEDIGLNNTNLILYDSYGPGDWRPKLLPLVRQAILQNNRISLSEPDIIIDITHIDDVVNACILAKEKQILTASENVFCVSGERYKISQLMELIEKIVGKKLVLKWGEYSLPDKKIKDPRRASKGSNTSKIIKEFLKIKCPINKAAKELNKFFKKHKINLFVDQKYFPVSKNKISKLNVVFSSAFGRQLEYYTGIVFKIDIKLKSKIINCCNGGRYDKLISDLGSKKQTPAVGAAFNLNYQS